MSWSTTSFRFGHAHEEIPRAPIFRRKGRTDRAAAAVAWMTGRANDSVSFYSGLTAQELLDWFGVTGSVSGRAQPFLRANGVDPHRLYGGMELGTPDLLVGERRARIIEARERWMALPHS